MTTAPCALTCPKCGTGLLRVSRGKGCYYGPDCTHACPGCGWHWAWTDD